MWDARMTTTLWLCRSVVAALAYGLASLLHGNNKTYIHENDYAVVEEEIKQIYMEQFTYQSITVTSLLYGNKNNYIAQSSVRNQTNGHGFIITVFLRDLQTPSRSMYSKPLS